MKLLQIIGNIIKPRDLSINKENDCCEKMLNIQPGFHENCGVWTCTECGFANEITPDEIYVSEDEFQTHLKDPYLGLSDMDILHCLYTGRKGCSTGSLAYFLSGTERTEGDMSRNSLRSMTGVFIPF